jgi:hypothetical protein
VARFCHERIFGRVYQAFVGKALPQGQDYTSALAIDELYKAVLRLLVPLPMAPLAYFLRRLGTL